MPSSNVCDTCRKRVKPDYFGNLFETCGPCVADRWLAEFVASRVERRGAAHCTPMRLIKDRKLVEGYID